MTTLTVQTLGQGRDDFVLVVVGEARVQRQRQEAVVRLFGLGERVGCEALRREQRVTVDRYVVHLDTDAVGAHAFVRRGTIRHADREEVVGVLRSDRRFGRQL